MADCMPANLAKKKDSNIDNRTESEHKNAKLISIKKRNISMRQNIPNEVLAPPPPPPIALPLLIGLSRRPRSSYMILKEALLQFKSSISISRWLLRIVHLRRSKALSKSNIISMVSSSKSNISMQSNFPNMSLSSYAYQQPCHCLHWIFRSLLSPSIRVRRYASQLILEGWISSQSVLHKKQSDTKKYDLKQITPKENGKSSRRCRDFLMTPQTVTTLLFQVIHYLTNTTLDIDAFHFSDSMDRLSPNYLELNLGYVSSTEGGDPAVQLFGLLNFLLSENATANATYCTKDTSFNDLLLVKKSTLSSETTKKSKKYDHSTTDNKKKRKFALSHTGSEISSEENIFNSSLALTALKNDSIFNIGNEISKEKKNEFKTKDNIDGRFSKNETNRNNSSSSSYAVTSFIACGGLRWISRSALRLISYLIASNGYHPSKSDTNRIYGKLSGSFHEAIHVRLTLLIDLSHRLLIHNTKQKIHPHTSNLIQSIFWSSNLPAITFQNVPLSPLAVFICIHQIMKTGYSGNICTQSGPGTNLSKKGVDKTLSALARIIDPDSNRMNSSSKLSSLQPKSKNSFSQAAHKLSGSQNKSSKKKRKMNFIASRSRSSSSNHDCETDLEALPTSTTSTYSFRRDDDERNASDLVTSAVQSAFSNVEDDMEDIEEEATEEEEDDDDEEDHAIDELSENNNDQEDIDEAMIILEGNHDGPNSDETDEINDNEAEEEDEELDEEEGEEEEEGKDTDEEIPSEDEPHEQDEDVVMEIPDDDANRNSNSSPQPSDFKFIRNKHEKQSNQQHLVSNRIMPPEKNKGEKRGNEIVDVEKIKVNRMSKVGRRHAYLQAALRLLESHHSMYQKPMNDYTSSSMAWNRSNVQIPLLSSYAERSLIQSLCDIVRPPPKPLNLKVYMRRAPTQEEFFRGNLSKNPIPISSLTSSADANTGKEPTFTDLRQHIANDLQMSDSAELLELLVAGKIINLSLKLRAVQQVLWRKYVLDSANNSNDLGLSSTSGYTSDTDTSSLPAMIVTYRLAGVDGEATEDKVEESDIADPLASTSADSSKTIEKEFGVTKIITEGRGISVLLRSVELDLKETLRTIRRDKVRIRRNDEFVKNVSLEKFAKSDVGPALVLLKYCSRLKLNRTKMVQARAPSLLLRLLLDVLNAIDKGSFASNDIKEKKNRSEASGTEPTNPSTLSSSISTITNNPTANALQELIEVLASDISGNTESQSESKDSNEIESEDFKDVSLSLLLHSLKESCLSVRFRIIIANLLPFLTYGQVDLSQTLASDFVKHVNFELLGDKENMPPIMMTFIETAVNLPAVEVCNTLRAQLVSQGFVAKVVKFVMETVPDIPPVWSPALSPKHTSTIVDKAEKENLWRAYLTRKGLHEAFKILIGLCKMHNTTQSCIAGEPNILKIFHWIENTSDTAAGIDLKGIGLLAETLLDALKEGNDEVNHLVKSLRLTTKRRKKEIAEERRNRALVGMKFLTSDSNAVSRSNITVPNESHPSISTSNDTIESILDLAITSFTSNAQSSRVASLNNVSNNSISSLKNDTVKRVQPMKAISLEQPSWLAEMEAMEDESGITCAICHEGATFKPKELIGMYAYVKKITIPCNKGGIKASIDGTHLFLSLPNILPDKLVGTDIETTFFHKAKAIAKTLNSNTSNNSHTVSLMTSSSLLNSRPSTFITTVSAGTAIHCSCHTRARQADRNHPKAPKSEWEGASLRNSRVACNIIIPLFSSNTAEVPLGAVESALSDYQTALVNTIGGRPKAMIWTVLHDVRFLLLRIAYGESLSVDCGGGSLVSNISLVFYLLIIAKMFSKHADQRTSTTVQHARNLSAAFISAFEILKIKETSTLQQSLADAAPMAAICTILFFEEEDDNLSGAICSQKRLWNFYKYHFVRGLIRCAGRRMACEIKDSGCLSGRTGGKRFRSNSFAEWEVEESDDSVVKPENDISTSSIEDQSLALRPMIILFAILDEISEAIDINICDEKIASSAEKVARKVEKCNKAKNIQDLIQNAQIPLENIEIMSEFKKGM